MVSGLSRRALLVGGSALVAVFAAACALPGRQAAAQDPAVPAEVLYVSSVWVPAGTFTRGIEGPACDAAGNLYAVNLARQGTIGRVTPAGEASVFVTLPAGSTGNGIRFDSQGRMLVADYTGHNVLRVDMASLQVSVFAHEPRMSQPNDLAITSGDVLYASDPNWGASSGRVWRIGTDGVVTLIEEGMGTTNGIEVGPQDTRLYVNESSQRNLWVYDLSPDGEPGTKRLLLQFADYGLDGMRCDVDGNLYVARYGKGTVAKVSPEGQVLLEVSLTGTNPSNVAFGGPDGRTC
ncbi:MAG: SMP-30/gluconolactonase/LRE family protein [Candidatus Latescibacterota bacterium]